MRRGAALLSGVLAAGCGLWPFGAREGPAPDPSQAIAWVEDAAVVDFYQRASTFYQRLAHRRFDSIETYQDETLRDFFADEAAFADYYADLTSALADAHFARNRPIALEVVELRLEGPGRARVQARLVGEDGRPLRPGTVELDRVDRWERLDGRWRIVPGPG